MPRHLDETVLRDTKLNEQARHKGQGRGGARLEIRLWIYVRHKVGDRMGRFFLWRGQIRLMHPSVVTIDQGCAEIKFL